MGEVIPLDFRLVVFNILTTNDEYSCQNNLLLPIQIHLSNKTKYILLPFY